MQTAIPCTVMRGGTSKGLYFLSDDLRPWARLIRARSTAWAAPTR